MINKWVENNISMALNDLKSNKHNGIAKAVLRENCFIACFPKINNPQRLYVVIDFNKKQKYKLEEFTGYSKGLFNYFSMIDYWGKIV